MTNSDEKIIGFGNDRWIVMNLDNGFWQAEVTYKNKILSFCHHDMNELWQVRDLIDGLINLVEKYKNEQ